MRFDLLDRLNSYVLSVCLAQPAWLFLCGLFFFLAFAFSVLTSSLLAFHARFACSTFDNDFRISFLFLLSLLCLGWRTPSPTPVAVTQTLPFRFFFLSFYLASCHHHFLFCVCCFLLLCACNRGEGCVWGACRCCLGFFPSSLAIRKRLESTDTIREGEEGVPGTTQEQHESASQWKQTRIAPFEAPPPLPALFIEGGGGRNHMTRCAQQISFSYSNHKGTATPGGMVGACPRR